MRNLALEFVGTVRRNGQEGVTDAFDTSTGFAEWLRANDDLITEDTTGMTDDATRARVVALRWAVRTLFSQAVPDYPEGRPDAGRLLEPAAALAEVNAAAAAVLRAPQLDGAHLRFRQTTADPTTRLLAELARAAIEFLTGPTREQLRACPAPRCTKYFVQDHPRQAWCKPSCGNRARASRYYQRHQSDQGQA